MFVDKSIGNPLQRKQLKWLLVAFVVVSVVVVLALLSMSMREPAPDAARPVSGNESLQMQSTQEEIEKQLEALAAEDAKDPAPKPTQEEIEKQLEALAAEDAKDPAPKPTQKEIEKQLEELSRQ